MDGGFSNEGRVGEMAEAEEIIRAIKDRQSRRFRQRSPWQAFFLAPGSPDLSFEEDSSGVELQRDWAAVGDDLRIAMLRHDSQASYGQPGQSADRKTGVSMASNLWMGPLPSPDILGQYDPDTRRAIVAVAEKEQGHRHKYREQKLQENSRVRHFGFIISLASLVGGIYLASADEVAVASILIFAAISPLIASVVFSWRKKIQGRTKMPGLS